MKRCPKCNRTFPDENQKFCTFDGGLLIAQPPFDPNATIRATAAEVQSPTTDSRQEAPTSRGLPNPNETIMASAPTAYFPRTTDPSGGATSADLPPPPQTVAPLSAATSFSQSSPLAPSAPIAAPPQPSAKKSLLPWILGAIFLLLLLGGAGLAAVFFVAIKPRLEQMSEQPVVAETPAATPAEETTETAPPSSKPSEEPSPATDTFTPPANAVNFVNSKDRLNGKLAEHYVDFSFYYPGSWQSDPKAGIAGASNFARVFKTVKEGTDEYTPESVAVSWYSSNGTYDADVSVFPNRVETLSTQLSKDLPNYRKVSEGPTAVNSLKAYDFHFSGVNRDPERGDLPYWGRAIFIPLGNEENKSGVTIIMLATARTSDVQSEEDVGVKGDMSLILESFRLGRKN